jgi:hypothetical protein
MFQSPKCRIERIVDEVLSRHHKLPAQGNGYGKEPPTRSEQGWSRMWKKPAVRDSTPESYVVSEPGVSSETCTVISNNDGWRGAHLRVERIWLREGLA